ncbi:MAG: tetratricopeptide repeat protein, partial [Gammaproteobacteria bacterium]|nr:tetratricopeptide repeat protein [Gammaproteobacteria bacterium]
MQGVKIVSIFIWILLFTSAVFASAEKDFEQGISFFKAANYTSAVVKFESAKKQGLKTVSLYYNLASSYYKLGDFKNSKRYFNQVAQVSSMRDLAKYNLGLIALKEGDKVKAREFFSSITNSATDQKLVKLSRKQLSGIDKVKKQKKSSLKVFLSSNIGHSDNIDSVADDGTVSGESDSFYNVFVSVPSLISGKPKAGWSFDGTLYKLDYFASGDYDEFQYAAGLKKEQKLADWDTSVKINLSKNDYAGDDYLSTLKLEAKGRKRLSKQERLYLLYQYSDISSKDVSYDYLEGSQQRARVEYRDYGSKNVKQLYYELEINDRGQLVGIDTYDYSPARHTLRGKYTHVLNKKWRLHGDLSYRFSDYPASDTVNRDDDRWKFAVSTDYRLDKTFKLTSKLQFLDNASSVDRYN